MGWEAIPGYSGFLPLYDEAVRTAREGAVFVEVGVALGHSIAYLARRVLDAGKRVEVWGVDPWGGTGRNGEQNEFAERAGGDFTLFIEEMRRHAPAELEIVRIVRAPSVRAAALFKDESVDFVLIDGPHDVDSVRADIDAWLPKVRPGGVLAGDDHEAHYPGVEEACREAFGPRGYEVIGTSWRVRL